MEQGWQQPTKAQLTKGAKIRGVGALWSEWGNMDSYGWLTKITYWTSDQSNNGYYGAVYLSDGTDYNVDPIVSSRYAVCRQSL